MSEPSDQDAPATRLVTGGRKPEWTGAAVSPPVWRSSTVLYDTCAALAEGNKTNADGHFFYGRRGSPTQWALADALTALEPGAAGTILYPSGVAAIAGALLTVLRPGDVLLMTDNAYDPSRSMGTGLLRDLGIETRFFDPTDVDGFAGLIDDRTKAVMLESPGSLTMEVADVPALAAAAKARGLTVLIDNTWATPLGFKPLRHGCDLAIMSLTKHIGGHSDLMMGSVTATAAWYRKLRMRSQGLGQVVSPDDAALALRGMRTMGLRLERQTASAFAIAAWLQQRPEVSRVLCPLLPSAPGHDLWRRNFTGGCGLFSFVLRGATAETRAQFIDSLRLFGIGFSWGGFESLALPIEPAPLRKVMDWPAEDRAIRLSIGLEDPQDLIADLAAAFEGIKLA